MHVVIIISDCEDANLMSKSEKWPWGRGCEDTGLILKHLDSVEYGFTNFYINITDNQHMHTITFELPNMGFEPRISCIQVG